MTEEKKTTIKTVTTVGGTISVAMLALFWNVHSEVDSRIRAVEMNSSATTVHIEGLSSSVKRIEEKIDRILERRVR